MTKSDLEVIARAIAPVLRQKLEALEHRIAALEAKPAGPGVKWMGTFQPGTTYGEGHLITKNGALWLCLADTGTAPGTSSSWRLVVKEGRAPRD